MAGLLEGFVLDTRECLPVLPAGGRAVPLNAPGLAFVPLTRALRLALSKPPADAELVLRVLELGRGVASWANEVSRVQPLFYLLAEFFGGLGVHEVVGWHNGAVSFGPLRTQTPGESAGDDFVTATGTEMAINQALRWMGVGRSGDQDDGLDEFASVGLDRFRWTEEWATS